MRSEVAVVMILHLTCSDVSEGIDPEGAEWVRAIFDCPCLVLHLDRPGALGWSKSHSVERVTVVVDTVFHRMLAA